MQKPQYAILRFAKYKGPEIGQIEAHNERKKEKYASNPDVDVSRSHLNYHLVQPERKYRAEAEKQIAEAGCRTRKDSVRVVEALVTASPEFFKGKKRAEIRTFFEEAVRFITKHQDKSTIISAVVHMDEKTPHMHLSFVPLTPDKRLSAKDIVGNKKKLTWWQDSFWKHMVRKYPDLERGESASETGRTHIPPRLFKEAAHLNRQREMAALLLAGIKNTGVGVPAVHQDIGPRLIRKRAKNLQGHVDFRAVFRAAAFQGITQRSISGPNDGSMDLMPIDNLPLQMGVMPSGPLCWTFRL